MTASHDEKWFTDLAVSGLRQRDPQVWTALLRAQPSWRTVTVRRVRVRSMQRGWSGAALRRYTVTLESGRSLTFIGKRINAYEARVLAVLKDRAAIDMPQVYCAQDGWCVMEALPPGKAPTDWTAGDARAALTNLARLHAAFWERPPEGLNRLDAVGLNQQLDKAARELSLIERMGGWPGLIEPPLMRAMRRMLDERERFLPPLLNQPVTLLHGDAWMPNWHITPDRCALLDWEDAVIGPAVWDLNYFLEIAAVYKTTSGQWQVCLPPKASDESVMFYLDQLEGALGRSVDHAAFEAALTAAFVVNTLTLWLGFAEDYGMWTNALLAFGRLIARLPARLRRAVEDVALSNQVDFLRQTFARFERYVSS